MGNPIEYTLTTLGRAAQEHSSALADLASSVYQEARALDRGEYVDMLDVDAPRSKGEYITVTAENLSEALRSAREAGASEQQVKIALAQRALPTADSVESAL